MVDKQNESSVFYGVPGVPLSTKCGLEFPVESAIPRLSVLLPSLEEHREFRVSSTQSCQTPSISEEDDSIVKLMVALVLRCASIADLPIPFFTVESQFFVFSSKLLIFVFSQIWPVKSLMRM